MLNDFQQSSTGSLLRLAPARGNLNRSNSQKMVDALDRFLFTSKPMDDLLDARSDSVTSASDVSPRSRNKKHSTSRFEADRRGSSDSAAGISKSGRKLSLNVLESVISPSVLSKIASNKEKERSEYNQN